jgi:hypothetical protein
MAEPPRDDLLAHIHSIGSRTNEDVARLAQALRRRSWPAGDRDVSEPIAAGWLQRWRPGGPAPDLPFCGCANGRCLVCN